VKGFVVIVETATIIQNTLTEVLQATLYAQIPIDTVRVIEEFGVYGDSTTGTYYNFLNGEDIIANNSFPQFTSFNRDYVATIKHPAKPNSPLRLYIFAPAASPGKYKVYLKGKDFKLDEL
jgi:hypothetical protein